MLVQKILVNIYIEFERWRWSALTMGFVDKRPKKYKEILFDVGQSDISFLFNFFIKKSADVLGDARSKAPAPIHLTKKVHRGRVNVRDHSMPDVVQEATGALYGETELDMEEEKSHDNVFSVQCFFREFDFWEAYIVTYIT